EVVTVIRSQGGTIDKFIGDAVMALWNAPKPQPDHPLGAALAAIDAVSVVDRLNERWAVEGKPAMQTRIGISTASVVVGNIGSSQRLSYTALGDGVNLTARLEGANKVYGTSILASQALISRLPAGVVAAQAVDILVVRGKAEGVRIYEILGRAGEVPGHRLEAAGIYEEAFELYLARDFGRAARLFRQVSELLPGYRPAELLLDRCLLFAADPPSETWDGSFALNTK
ncbi:MAG: adenylate/guanylate cyclase domain-containing protein, partial [Myxococcota bacterium]